VHTKTVSAHALRRGLMLAGAALALLAGTGGARAFEYQVGDYQVSFDTTLSSSVEVRASPVDYSLVGEANGGGFPVANADNGDLNFKNGLVGATQRVTEEFQIKRDDYGIFVRATGFWDPIYDDNTDSHEFPLSRAAVRDVGTDMRLLDAYVFASPEIFGHPVDLRVGNQALNWGESTFIQFGINSITPLDVTALHIPGSELRTAFLPIPAVDAKTEIIPDLTIESFWQPYWTRTKLDPVGSFFSTTDGLTDGGTYSNLFSLYPDEINCVQAVNLIPQSNPFGGCLPRSEDRHPTGVGEYGFALRETFPGLGDTEVGLYYENYDSRTPFADFHTGSSNISGPNNVLPNVPLGELLALPYVYAGRDYSDTDSFFADYPSDIHLLGASFSFTGPAGVAVQGEVSHRFNQPIQLAGSDLALAVNAPAICLLAESPLFHATVEPACQAAHADPVIAATGGVQPFETAFNGWVRKPVTQAQTTLTKLFAAEPELYINSIALVGEIGMNYVSDLGDPFLYNSPYSTDTNCHFSTACTVDTKITPGHPGTGILEGGGNVTAFAASYTLLMIVDMPNLLPYGIGMKPTFSIEHDFTGTSPLGANIWVAKTGAASVGVTFSYLQAWTLGVQYTNHFALGNAVNYDGNIDRDFFSATLSYEF
jgi:Protein of unknown function (DUF1302)